MVKLLLIAATGLLVACAARGPVDDGRAPAAEPGTPEAQGRALYVSSCQRCHALYMPDRFTGTEWSYYVRKYGRKARLDEGERQLVEAYLRASAP